VANKRGIILEVDGLTQTLAAFRGLTADMRPIANRELRGAGRECSTVLVGNLRTAAAGSGVPVAPNVARSARVKSDRLPSVTIGGTTKVGRYGAIAAKLMWGSEHGGHNFAAGPSAGYWIAPTVARFKDSQALVIYKKAVYQIMRKWKLI